MCSSKTVYSGLGSVWENSSTIYRNPLGEVRFLPTNEVTLFTASFNDIFCRHFLTIAKLVGVVSDSIY